MARLARFASEPTSQKLHSRHFLFLSASALFKGFFVLIVFCDLGTNAGPAGNRSISKCVAYCKESTKFAFKTDQTYIYEYRTEISSSVFGNNSDKKAKILLASKARISVLSPCEFQLDMEKVSLKESKPETGEFYPVEGSENVAHALTERPLKFSFQDGRIEHLCVSEDDPTWVVNIKRGLLSTIQHSADLNEKGEANVKEVDVNGRCLTSYISGENSVKKSKDLTSCTQRHSYMTALQSIPYSSSSTRQSVQLLKGTQRCNQTIENSIIVQVECEEIHKFQPFESKESGAQTLVTQSLTLKEQHSKRSHKTLDDGESWRRTTLLFETSNPHNDSPDEDINVIFKILEILEKDTNPEVRTEAPHHFIDLVENLRNVDYNSLKIIFAKEGKNPNTKKILLDAMPLIGTAPSLHFMRDLILQKSLLSDSQVDAWLTSLIFIKEPTIEMISALLPLLKVEEPREQALFGISSVIYLYCKKHTDCIEEKPVSSSIRKIIAQVGKNCRSESRLKSKRIVSALKALGNAGQLPADLDHGYRTLIRCMGEKSNPTDARLAAIDVFRRIPCNADFYKTPILNLYKNMKENTEVRIKAYLISMKCASRKTIETVMEVLQTDSVNQVGSFVWTHLTNLQETSSPDKQAIRNILTNDFLKNKFNTDARKYSRNYEGAFYKEDLNIGAGYDSNIIFTPESFLPKSAMVNLTAHVFGESINIVEFGARVQSLEQLLEPLFGPNGYFPDESITEALHSVRTKRDVKNNEIERLGSLFEQATPASDKLPGGSIYGRIFGHEILYKTFEVSDKTSVPTLYDENGKNWLDITRLFDNLSTGKGVDYTKSSMLLDAAYSVPTSAGIPLSLGIQATMVYGINAKGKFDLSNFWESKEIEVQGLLRPSASVQIDGVMTILIGKNIRSGLKVQNNLHTSTAVQGRVVLKGRKLIHAELTLPQDKQEIFGAKSELIIVGPSGKTLISNANNDEEMTYKVCSPKMISKILGIKICGSMNVPERFDTFPLQSPAAMSVYVEKTDVFKSYQFDFRHEQGPTTAISFVFNTPGSQINRRLSIDYMYNREQGKFEASIHIPDKALSAEGRYQKSIKSIQINLKDGDQQIIYLSSAIRILNNRYDPNFIFTYYEKPIVSIHGKLDLIKESHDHKKANFDLTMSHVTQKPIRVHGELSSKSEGHNLNFGIESSKLTGNVRSYLRLTHDHLSTRSTIEYSWDGAEERKMDLSTKIQRSKRGDLKKYNAMVSFNSEKPGINLELYWETMLGGGYFENTAKVGWNKIEWIGHTLYKNQREDHDRQIEIQLSLSSPKKNINYQLEFEHKLSETQLLTRILARTDDTNEIRGMLTCTSILEHGLQRKNARVGLTWPGFEYSLKGSLNEVKSGEFEGELIINPNNNGQEMKATLTYKNKSHEMKLDYVVDFWARGFITNPIQAGGTFSSDDRNFHLNTVLEIEGKDSWSGRWTTSFNYNVLKGNVHRIEGKLGLNEKKFSGNLTYRLNRDGYKSVILDLQIHKHILIDTKWKIIWPTQISGKFAFYPDRDGKKNEKIELHMGISKTDQENSASLKFDYFGEIISGEGRLSPGKLVIEANWLENKQFFFSVDAPEVSLERTLLTIDVRTPFNGFENNTLIIRHRMDGNQIESQLNGKLMEREVLIVLSGIFALPDSKFSLVFDLNGYPRLEGDIILQQSREKKVFEFIGKRGDTQKVIKLEHIESRTGTKCSLFFTGSNYIPEVSIQLKRDERKENTTTNLDINWIRFNRTESEERKQLLFTLNRKKSRDFNYEIEWRSPWENFESLSATISYTNRNNLKEIDLGLRGSYKKMPILPLALIGRFEGDRKNFKANGLLNWPGDGDKSTLKVYTEGKLKSHLNSKINTKVQVVGHVYEINFESDGLKKDGQMNSIQININFDGVNNSGGLKWAINQKNWKKLESLIWVEFTTLPKLSLKVEHEIGDVSSGSGGIRHFKGKIFALKNEENIVKMSHELHLKSSSNWNYSASIHSDVIQGSLTSEMSNLKDGEIHHSTRISGFSMVDSLDFEMNLRKGQEFELIGRYGKENEIKIDGSFESRDDGRDRKFELRVNTPWTNAILGSGTYKMGRDDLSISLSSALDQQELFTLSILGKNPRNGRYEGNLEFKCPFGHNIVGKGLIDLKDKSMQLVFEENEAQLLSFNIEGKVKDSEGNLLIFIKTPVCSYLEGGLETSTKYQITDGSIKYEARYSGGHDKKEYKLKSHAQWTEDEKNFLIEFQGLKTTSISFELHELSRLEGKAVWQDNVLGNVLVSYQMVANEDQTYAFGTHEINLKLDIPDIKAYDFILTISVDPTKFKSTIKTPFSTWETIGFEGQLSYESHEKEIKVIISRANSQIELLLRGHLNERRGKCSFTIKTPIKGYTSLKGGVIYTREQSKDMKVSLEIHGSIESQTMNFKSSFSAPKFLKIEMRSPYTQAKYIDLDAQWDLIGLKKTLNISTTLNENQKYEIGGTLSLETDNLKGEAELIMKNSHGGGGVADSLYKIRGKYDIKNEYKANLKIERSNEKEIEIGGLAVIGKDSFRLEIISPFKRLEKIEFKGNWGKPTINKYEGAFEWKFGHENQENKGRIELEINLENGLLELKSITPFKNWESSITSIKYILNSNHRKIQIDFHRGNEKPLQILIESKYQGNALLTRGENEFSNANALFRLETKLPLKSLENTKFKLSYDHLHNAHNAMGSLSVSGDVFESKFKVNVEKKDGKYMDIYIAGDYRAPIWGISPSSFEIESQIQLNGQDVSSVKFKLDHGGKRHAGQGTFQLSKQNLQIKCESTWNILRNFEFTGEFMKKSTRMTDGKLMLVWNDIKTDLNGKFLYNGIRDFIVKIDGSLPLEGYSQIILESEVKIVEGISKLSASFQDNRFRYMTSLDGVFSQDSTKYKLQINTPFTELRSFSTGLEYSSSSNNLGGSITVEKNAVEIIVLELVKKRNQIHLAIKSQFSWLPLTCKAYSEWNNMTPEFQLNFDGSFGKYDVNLKSSFGLKHVEFECKTSFKHFDYMNFSWNIEGIGREGSASASYIYGQKGEPKHFKTSWKNVAWKDFKADLTVSGFSVKEKNIAIQYTVMPQKNVRKMGGSLTYNLFNTLDEVSLTTTIKHADRVKSIELSIVTPYDVLKEGSLLLKLNKKPDYSFEIQAVRNREKVLNGNVAFTLNQLASRFKINFNSPLIMTETFDVNAMYDLSTPTKNLELLFKQGNYSFIFKSNAGIVEEPKKEIELKLSIESNIPLIPVSASGSIRASYLVDYEGSKQVSVTIDSTKTGFWQLTGKSRLTPSLKINFKLESPVDQIVPDIQVDLVWANMNGVLNLITGNDPEVKLILNLEGFSSVRSVEGKNLNKRITFEVERGVKKVEFEAVAQSDSLSVILESNWNLIKSSSLEMSLSQTGQLTIHGKWGDQSVQIFGLLANKKGYSYLKSTKSDLILTLNSVEIFTIKSDHLFEPNQYSFNITIGDSYSASLYLQTLNKFILATKIQWSSKDFVNLHAESDDGNYKASLSTPWLKDIDISGKYKLVENEYSGICSFTYDQIKSSIDILTQISRNNFKSNIIVDLPQFSQKVKGQVNLNIINEDNIEGLIEMDLSDRKFSIRGDLSTITATVNRKKIQERELKLTYNFPSKSYSEIKTEFRIKSPEDEDDFSSLAIEGSLIMPSGTSKIIFKYDATAQDNKKVIGEIRVESILIQPIEINFAFNKDLSATELTGHYSSNDLRFVWDFTTPKFNYEAMVRLPILGQKSEFSSWKVEGEGLWELQQIIESTMTFTTQSQLLYQIEFSTKRSEAQITSLISLKVPSLVKDKIELSLKLLTPSAGLYSIEIEGFSGKVSLDLNGELTAKEGHFSTSVRLNGALGSHFAKFGWNKINGDKKGFEVDASIESSAIIFDIKKLELSGTFSKSEEGVEALIKLGSDGREHYVGELQIYLKKEGGIQIKAGYPKIVEPITFNMYWKIEDQEFMSKIDLKVNSKIYSTEMRFNTADPEFQIEIHCPYIPSDYVKVHGKGVLKQRHLDLVFDIQALDAQWRSEAILRFATFKNMGIKLEIITPIKNLGRVTIDGQLGADEISFELHTPLESIPNAKFLLAGIPLIFVQNNWFEKWRGCEIILGLPSVTYNFKVTALRPNLIRDHKGEFGIIFEESYPQTNQMNNTKINQRYEAKLNIPSLEEFNMEMKTPSTVQLQLTTPLKFIQTIKLELTAQINWLKLTELRLVGNFNNKNIEFISKISNINEKRLFSIELYTPFIQYEKYQLILIMEKLEIGQNFQVELFQPSWQSPFRIDLDYRYRFKGLVDLEGEINVGSPVQNIPSLSLKIQSLLKNTHYKGLIEGIWGKYHPKGEILAGYTHQERVYANIELSPGFSSERNHNFIGRFEVWKKNNDYDYSSFIDIQYGSSRIFSLHMSLINPEDSIEANVKITTQIVIFKSFEGILKISPKSQVTIKRLLSELDVNFELHLNEEKLVEFELVNVDGHRKIEIKNPIAPISLTLNFEKEKHKHGLKAEFCWNTNEALDSTIGIEYMIASKSSNQNIYVKLQSIPFGWVELSFDRHFTLSKKEHLMKLRWNKSDGGVSGVGYYITFNNDSTAKNAKYSLIAGLDIQSRILEIESHITANDRENSRCIELKWNKNVDPNKRIGARLTQMKKSSWQSISIKDTLTFVYSGLENDFTFTLDRAYKKGDLTGIQMSFDPTVNPVNRISFTLNQDVQKPDTGVEMQIIHKASNLYVNVVAKKSKEYGKEFLVRYMDVQGEKHMFKVERALKGEPLIQVFSGVESSPKKLLRIDHWSNDNTNIVKVNTPYGSIDAKLVLGLPYVELVLKEESQNQNGLRKFLLTAGFPNRKEINFKVNREINGQIYGDVLLSSRLNSSDFLSTKIYWRPELQNEIKQITFKDFQFCVETTKDLIRLTLNTVDKELLSRWNFMKPGVGKMIESFGNYTRNELEDIAAQVVQMGKFIQDHYERNSFFINDIMQLFSSGVDFMKTIWKNMEILEKGKIFKAAFAKNLSTAMQNLWKENAGKLENIFVQIWDDCENILSEFWNQHFSWIRNNYKIVVKYLKNILEVIDGKIEAIEEKILGSGFIKKALDYYYSYANWISELPFQIYIEKLKSFYHKKIREPLEIHYKPHIEALTKSIESGDIKSILEMPPFPYIRHVVDKLRKSTTKLIEYLEAERKIKELIQKSLHNMDDLIMRNLPSSSFVWAPENGKIEYHQGLGSLDWDDLTKMPIWRKTKQDQDNLDKMSELYYKIMHGFQNAKPLFDMNLREILPPFGATAVMAGDYHYYTFDKRHFQFAGECSYVLVADLLHKNFTLIVNYEKLNEGEIRKKSYTLISEEQQIDIDVDNFQVTLDNRKVELPLEIGTTFVRRLTSGLEIFDTRGFYLSCSQSPSICTVSTSGWYFGKLAGLLGTYDNEPSNDFQTPDGNIVTDVSEFVHSWRVGKKSNECSSKNFAYSNITVEETSSGICHGYFEEKNSPLRPCFEQIPIETFKNMCIHDTLLRINSATRDEAACTAVGAYVAECQNNGVDVWMPPSCVRCKLNDGNTILSGEIVHLETGKTIEPKSSADVVIIIEEASCLKNLPLDQLMTKLDSAMESEGLKDNLYAVVGYGGEGVHRKPHIRTVAGAIWSHNTIFQIPSNIPMNGDGRGDLYEAIEFAAGIGFRAGVSKTLVAITCGEDSCGSDGNYGDTLTLLVENDIKLHMLVNKGFTLKRAKKQDDLDQVYGIDLNGAYIGAHAKRQGNSHIEGDIGIKKQIILPKDMCTPLAMETNGTRFSLNLRNVLSRKFSDVWSTRVAQTAQPSDCQRCECVPDRLGGANVLCHQCISPNLKPFLDDWENYQIEELEQSMNEITESRSLRNDEPT